MSLRRLFLLLGALLSLATISEAQALQKIVVPNTSHDTLAITTAFGSVRSGAAQIVFQAGVYDIYDLGNFPGFTLSNKQAITLRGPLTGTATTTLRFHNFDPNAANGQYPPSIFSFSNISGLTI